MSDLVLLDALNARQGIICAVGAGGKKSTLYRILQAHPGRAAFTSSVFTHLFPDDLGATTVVADAGRIEADVIAAASNQDKIAYACPSDKPGRYHGLSTEAIARCHAGGHFDVTLVKADGARLRLMKAPGDGEPNLVAGTATVLGLVSARVIGKPLSDRYVHRPERIAAITGATPGDALTPTHIARLMAHPDGMQKHVGKATFIPVINMADGREWHAKALEAARTALTLSDRFDRVIIAAMREPHAILDVVD